MMGWFDMFLGTDGQQRRQEGGAAGGGEGSEQQWSICRARAGISSIGGCCGVVAESDQTQWAVWWEKEREAWRTVMDGDDTRWARGEPSVISRRTKLSNDELH